MNARILIPFVILVAGCKEPPSPAPQRTAAQLVQDGKDAAAIEAATPCVDVSYNMASYLGALSCARSDQRWTWEKDADGDAYGVCRCVHPESKP